ncbi:hypothetical protein [Candidatus Xianfuyuplasma coldseepsis]|uniref:Uncharacterized protein n=1 Tax=Candidatus Xianfuyuplasma coldseepsis TaxID=2782163 RepID=A0A7L7KQK7_9MOLU|nr:hypothetical protein [Xianfuyuplasma coldseepsis]QMS84865.1 hypothetical protein G4Z02_03550 [Xianfuyuplasma coldseepsis]
MAAKTNKAYLKQPFIVSLILAIIPITNIILGVLYRLSKKNLVLVILNIVLFPLFFIVDLVSVILNNDLKYLV